MYKLFDLIRAVRSALQPYIVVVVWEKCIILHRAWTRSDALQWAAMYPPSAYVNIRTRIGRFIGARYNFD